MKIIFPGDDYKGMGYGEQKIIKISIRDEGFHYDKTTIILRIFTKEYKRTRWVGTHHSWKMNTFRYVDGISYGN